MTRKIHVIGGGFTGLYVAHYLAKDADTEVTLIEKSPFVGGAATSFEHKGWILDYGPHKIYTQLPGILSEYKKFLGKDLLKVKKRNSIRLLDKYFDFPIKIAQVGLGVHPLVGVKMGLGFGQSVMKSVLKSGKPESYEDYFLRGFGPYAYNLLFKEMAWKVWGDPKKLSAELARKRVPVGNAIELVKTMLVKPDKSTSAEYFYYPRKGMRMLIDRIEKKLASQGVRVLKGTTVTQLKRDTHTLTQITYEGTEGTVTEATDYVVSTIGLNQMVSLLAPALSKPVRESAKQLKYRAIILVYIFVNKDKLFNENWIFFPEKKFIFNRIADLKSFSKEIGVRGKTVLTAEITVDPSDKLFLAEDSLIINKVVKDLEKAGILKKHMITETLVKKAANLYPVYTIGYRQHLNRVLDAIDMFDNFVTIGRQGFFNYNNTDHDIDMAKKTAKFILSQQNIASWKRLREIFDTYKIVD